MKQFTSIGQTAKLIELGFMQPRTKIPFEVGNEELGYTYSIGELIEMLNGVSELEIVRDGSDWGVYDELRAFTGEELIDNLFDMCVKLKEEGVI